MLEGGVLYFLDEGGGVLKKDLSIGAAQTYHTGHQHAENIVRDHEFPIPWFYDPSFI